MKSQAMTKSKGRQPRDTEGPTKAFAKSRGAKPEKAFDVWLQRGLHDLYDKVASEPIPDSILKLIEDDKAK